MLSFAGCIQPRKTQSAYFEPPRQMASTLSTQQQGGRKLVAVLRHPTCGHKPPPCMIAAVLAMTCRHAFCRPLTIARAGNCRAFVLCGKEGRSEGRGNHCLFFWRASGIPHRPTFFQESGGGCPAIFFLLLARLCENE